MYIETLQIKNLRNFAQTEITLNYPGRRDILYPNVNILLGENGAGKTTILRAAALGVLGPLLQSNSGYVPDNLIRLTGNGKETAAEIMARVRLTDEEQSLMPVQMPHSTSILQAELLPGTSTEAVAGNLQLRCRIQTESDIEKLDASLQAYGNWDILQANQQISAILSKQYSPSFFMVAYGATRRVEALETFNLDARNKSRLPRYGRITGLFEDYSGMVPLSFWLPQLYDEDQERHDEVVDLLNKSLPPSCRLLPTPDSVSGRKEHLFDFQGIQLPLRMLSDGYRNHIGWIADFLYHACTVIKDIFPRRALSDLRGLVLVDEIDLHLHPDWQRKLIPALAQTFPHMQFLFTSHSALLVGAMEADNLFNLIDAAQSDAQAAYEICQFGTATRGKGVDRILLSPYFGLSSTGDSDTEQEMRRLSNQAMLGDKQAAMAYLHKLGDLLGQDE